jgi:Domain of unknown function (DUF4124)
MLRLEAILIFGFALLSVNIFGEIYEYKDSKGNIIYSDKAPSYLLENLRENTGPKDKQPQPDRKK